MVIILLMLNSTHIHGFNGVNEMNSIFDDVFYVDPTSESGLRWKHTSWSNSKGHNAGDVAGYKKFYSESKKSYWLVTPPLSYIKNHNCSRTMRLHRIIAAITWGDDALIDMQVDHVNGDGLDNRVENLRLVDLTTNAQNHKLISTSKTGVQGVTFTIDKGIKRYEAAFYINNKKFTKTFSTRKYGDETAFKLACEFRSNKIKELNEQGAGYTERHGT